jgi:hypothetical protein
VGSSVVTFPRQVTLRACMLDVSSCIAANQANAPQISLLSRQCTCTAEPQAANSLCNRTADPVRLSKLLRIWISRAGPVSATGYSDTGVAAHKRTAQPSRHLPAATTSTRAQKAVAVQPASNAVAQQRHQKRHYSSPGQQLLLLLLSRVHKACSKQHKTSSSH